MELSNSMVRAAVNKAVEAGLLSRNGAQNEHDWEVMKSILESAFTAKSDQSDLRAINTEKLLGDW